MDTHLIFKREKNITSLCICLHDANFGIASFFAGPLFNRIVTLPDTIIDRDACIVVKSQVAYQSGRADTEERDGWACTVTLEKKKGI